MLPPKETDPDGFTRGFYQSSKKLTPILHNLFQKYVVSRTFPNLFYEADIIWIPKSGKYSIKIKL